MARIDERQGFLVSAIVHLCLMLPFLREEPPARPAPVDPAAQAEREARRVFVPRPEELRQMGILPPLPPPRPVATPPPAPSQARDRISVGAPGDQADRLVLRRDEDLTAQARKGQPGGAQAPQETPPQAPPQVAQATPAQEPEFSVKEQGRTGLPLPTRPSATAPQGGESLGRSIERSMRRLEQRVAEQSAAGIPTGTGQRMGPLMFDPEGADFTAWVNHFKNEVYRNWIIPQPALMGFKGHVDLEFTVERDGKVTDVRLLKSAGTPALDRAARNALLGSRLQPLPADYGPPRIVMQVTFYYNESPYQS